MSVLALITDEKAIDLVLPWAATFAEARDTTFSVVCWTHSAVPGSEMENPGPVSQDLVQAVDRFLQDREFENRTEVIGISGPDEARDAIVLVCVPLQHAMKQSLVESKPQPRVFPLAKTVMDALEERLEEHPDARLISAGEPSSRAARSDVMLILGTTEGPDPEFFEELIELVREKMRDESLVVEVHCVQEVWRKRSEGRTGSD